MSCHNGKSIKILFKQHKMVAYTYAVVSNSPSKYKYATKLLTDNMKCAHFRVMCRNTPVSSNNMISINHELL